MAKKERKPVGLRLVEEGLITNEQLKLAEEIAAKSKEPIETVLVKKGILREQGWSSFQASEMGVPYMDLIWTSPAI